MAPSAKSHYLSRALHPPSEDVKALIEITGATHLPQKLKFLKLSDNVISLKFGDNEGLDLANKSYHVVPSGRRILWREVVEVYGRQLDNNLVFIDWLPLSRGTMRYLGFANETFALMAYYQYVAVGKVPKKLNPGHSDFGYIRHKPNQLVLAVAKLKCDLVPDAEYNRLSGESCTKKRIPYEKPELVETLGEVACEANDAVLYNEFAANLDHWLTLPHSVKPLGKSRSVGMVELDLCESWLASSDKRKLTRSELNFLAGRGFAPQVGWLNRGSLKSDGSMRYVQPMNVLYELFLCRYIGNRPFVPREKKFQIIRKFSDLPGGYGLHGYDIKSCDRRVGPYFAKYCLERKLEFLYPYTAMAFVGGTRFKGYTRSFPSGVNHTTMVTEAFTCALIRQLAGKDAVAYVQGDGFLLDSPVYHDALRWTGTDEINGMKKTGGVWRYNRGIERLTTAQYIRPSKKLNGAELWHVRHWCYTKMRAVGLPHPCALDCDGSCGEPQFMGKHIRDLGWAQLGMYLRELDIDVPPLVRFASDQVGNPMAETGWDSVVCEPSVVIGQRWLERMKV